MGGLEMSRFRIAFAVLAFALMFSCLYVADQQPASAGTQIPSPGSNTLVTPASADAQTARKVTAYMLPPDLYKKAHDKSRIDFRLQLISFVYGLVVLWIVLRWKLGAKYRDWAQRTSGRRFVQALIFSPLLLLTIGVLTLPLDIYSET